MEKCQEDGIRVVASENNLNSVDSQFEKKKSLFQQKRITKYARRIKNMNNIKAKFPKTTKILMFDKLIKINKEKQNKQIKSKTNKRYNIYFNKSKIAYFGNRIEEIIQCRTGTKQELSDKENAIEKIKTGEMSLNTQKLDNLSSISFITQNGNEENQVHETLSGKNYSIKKKENECVWTVLKKDLKELAQNEKKRDVVQEEIEKLNSFEKLEKNTNEYATAFENTKEIEVCEK